MTYQNPKFLKIRGAQESLKFFNFSLSFCILIFDI